MATTPNRGYPYPAASDAPDGPGALYALAMALDADVHDNYQGFTAASNQSYVSGAALVLHRFGPFRLLNFSIQNNFDVEIGSGFLQVPDADKPASKVTGAGHVITGSGKSTATYYLQTDRSVVLASGPGGTGFTHEGTLQWFV